MRFCLMLLTVVAFASSKPKPKDKCEALAARYGANVVEERDLVLKTYKVYARVRNEKKVWVATGKDVTDTFTGTVVKARQLVAEQMDKGVRAK